MSPITRSTFFFGGLMIGLGVGYYFGTGMTSFTALIPAGLGVLLVIFGGIALMGLKARMIAMHITPVLALLGAAAATWRLVTMLGGPTADWIVVSELALWLTLCLIYIALTVKSFIDARRSRAEASPA